MIHNPILPGFHSDPCICRRGKDYYMAVASFEWFPGVPIYHSRDLRNWELYAHAITDDRRPDLRGLEASKGIWAPCLTYCEADDLFYVVYGVMHSTNARYFDVDNYLITARDVQGPWSEPVYLHSLGFDASMFHDDDGRKYVVSLEWETRDEYEKPGSITIMEYDPGKQAMVGEPRRIWRGGTDRGCLEAPHMSKRDGRYYLLCAEGGTGYYHCVTMARSRDVFGPYEGDPCNPILTSAPENVNERHDWDHLKPRYYNPSSYLQKSGHGSYVDTPEGETWMVYHASRPFVPELRCTLGRETAIQQMEWTKDGWLRMAGGGNLAKEYVTSGILEDAPVGGLPAFDDFDGGKLGAGYYAPRISPERFVDLTSRPGWARLRGQESGTSAYHASILVRKLTGLYGTVTTKMEFYPQRFQHTAGLILYHDNMNFLYLYKGYDEALGSSILAVIRVDNGRKREYPKSRCQTGEGSLWLRVSIEGRKTQFQWSDDGEAYRAIGPCFDTSELSDEYSEYSEFTGAFVGIACGDRFLRRHTADFDFLDYQIENFSGADRQ